MTEKAAESTSSQEERFTAYASMIRSLKERGTLREVMERELIMEFARTNQQNINEFPLLDIQQKGIVDLVSGRMGDHPGHEYVSEMVNTFVVQVSRYEKAQSLDDKEQLDKLVKELSNTETLLIKLLQGIVFVMGLVTDNFEELVLHHFGQSSLEHYNGLIEKYELDQTFWKALVEHFVSSQVREAYDDIIANDRFSIAKDQSHIFIRFQFDDILARLNPTSSKIEKTRIQTAYEASKDDGDGQAMSFVGSILLRGLAFMPDDALTNKDVHTVTRLVCIDPAVVHIREKYAETVKEFKELHHESTTPEDSEQAALLKARMKFLTEQIVSVGVGAAIALGIIRHNFLSALNSIIPGESETFRTLTRTFDLATLESILFKLLENSFVHLLREKGAKEGGKLIVRTERTKRVPTPELMDVADLGLNKFRRAKLFKPDPRHDDKMLFIPKNRREFIGLLQLMQMEDKLVRAVATLWERSSLATEIIVVVDLKRVARTTTNLKVRLREILDLYGVIKG